MRAELQTMGHCHSRKRVARLMRLAGLAGRYPRRFRRTTISDPLTVIPDLVQRNFAPTGPNRLWVGDITYIRTWGGLTLLGGPPGLLLPAGGGLVHGWSPPRRVALGCPAHGPGSTRSSTRADPPRRPRLPVHGRGLHHGPGCPRHPFQPQPAHNCWDNAVAESFFATLTSDLVYHHPWPTRAVARSAIFEYIEAFYNPRRIHSTLGNLSQVAYETRHLPVAQSA